MKKHIAKHLIKHWHKIHKSIYHVNHTWLHIWEIVLVGALWFASLLFAWSSNLPNNTSFSYPLQQVSTVECRTLYRNDMPNSCKINLPVIYWANYSKYKNNELYRSIYTTLRAAPYSDSWNQKIWAHAWLDIATARGTPLFSIWDWEVYSAWWNSAYWNLVRIKYVYNWEVVYWVYAHMDSIEVKKWDKVSKWQHIWTVWNSWNTFGKLWWYHLHFEIDKDNHWRPAYSYTNCPDLDKWHYKIIQNWLCRNELFSYQYDPIRLLEPTNIAVSVPDIVDNSDNDTIDIVDDSNQTTWMNDLNIMEDDSKELDDQLDKWNSVINSNNDSHNSSITNYTNDITHDTTANNGSNTDSNTNKNDNSNIIIEDDTNINYDSDTTENNNNIVDNTSNDVDEDDPYLIELDFSWLKYLAEHFVRLRDIQMRSELKESSLLLWETVTLDIEVFKKWKELEKELNYYNGILNVPIEFMTNNSNVSIDVNSLQLINKWKGKIEITWNKPWKSVLIIKIDDQKVWVLEVSVK